MLEFNISVIRTQMALVIRVYLVGRVQLRRPALLRTTQIVMITTVASIQDADLFVM